MDVRHRTCHQIDVDADPPEMRLERVEDDMAIYACPFCNHKISVLMFFEKEHEVSKELAHEILRDRAFRDDMQQLARQALKGIKE